MFVGAVKLMQPDAQMCVFVVSVQRTVVPLSLVAGIQVWVGGCCGETAAHCASVCV